MNRDLVEVLSKAIVDCLKETDWQQDLASRIAEEVLAIFNENVSLGQAIKEMQEESTKPILCLNFDGVCHSYTSGWQGADNIQDDPVLGLFEFLDDASMHFRIAIHSSRSHQPGGIAAMKNWFMKYGILHAMDYPDSDVWSRLEFPMEKPPAKVTIDDRCIRFEGLWPEMDELVRFQPWKVER